MNVIAGPVDGSNVRAVAETFAWELYRYLRLETGGVDGWWVGSLELYKIDLRPWCSEMDAGVFIIG